MTREQNMTFAAARSTAGFCMSAAIIAIIMDAIIVVSIFVDLFAIILSSVIILSVAVIIVRLIVVIKEEKLNKHKMMQFT